MSLVQYVIVRGDLTKVLKWPLGSVIAQGCHATTAVNHLFRDDPDTVQYFSDLDNMHKVVLQADDEDALRNLSTTLTAADVKHKLWIEQPENIATCLAIKPYPKETVFPLVRAFKLLR